MADKALRLLDLHRSYLVIAIDKNDVFAESACEDVARELGCMRDRGMLIEDMANELVELLLRDDRTPQSRAKLAARMIWAYVQAKGGA